MKKVMITAFTLLTILTLSACGGTSDVIPDPEVNPLSSEASLATLSYLSTGFLDGGTDPVVGTLGFLVDEDPTVIEDELDEVNVYFDRLKAMIDNGVESFGSVVEEPSDNELYEYKLTFTVNEEVYVIYYNLDDVTGEMTGIIVIGDVEYTFEVVDNMREYEYEVEEKNEYKNDTDNSSNGNGKQNDDEEDDEIDQESDDELDDELDDEVEDEQDDELDDETETKMMLIARNGDDYIKIMYKTETDEEEVSTKFDMEQSIGGVVKHISLKIEIEEDEYKVRVVDGENTYTFKQETEEDGVIEYKLEYEVDGVKGFVKIIETIDENGDVIYEYKIQEAGRARNVEREKPHYDFDDDDEEDPEGEDDGSEV